MEADGADGAATRWLRYHHYAHPEPWQWEQIRNGEMLPRQERPTVGSLIMDGYAYNYNEAGPYHWVGDLALEATVTVNRKSPFVPSDLVGARAGRRALSMPVRFDDGRGAAFHRGRGWVLLMPRAQQPARSPPPTPPFVGWAVIACE